MLLKEPALEAGIEGYHRVSPPGTSPELIGALAELVRGAKSGALPPCVIPEGHTEKCPRRGATKA